jgi:hypothetical protein
LQTWWSSHFSTNGHHVQTQAFACASASVGTAAGESKKMLTLFILPRLNSRSVGGNCSIHVRAKRRDQDLVGLSVSRLAISDLIGPAINKY